MLQNDDNCIILHLTSLFIGINQKLQQLQLFIKSLKKSYSHVFRRITLILLVLFIEFIFNLAI